MATFTTWAALYQKMLDDLMSRNTSVGSYTLNTGTTVRTISYTSFSDLKEQLQFVKMMKDEEAGAFKPRTLAGNRRPC